MSMHPVMLTKVGLAVQGNHGKNYGDSENKPNETLNATAGAAVDALHIPPCLIASETLDNRHTSYLISLTDANGIFVACCEARVQEGHKIAP